MARLEEQTNKEIEEMTKRTRSSVEESKTMEEKMSLLNKDKAKNDQKVSQLNSKIAKLSAELKEERQINQSLGQNQVEWQKKLEQCEERMRKIEENKDKEIQTLRVSWEQNLYQNL